MHSRTVFYFIMNAEIVIIGGGAAGLMAAVGASASGAETVVLEKMPRPGRKIMISGKGRCNMTNLKDWQDFSVHIHPKPNILKHAFYNFSPEDTVRFFNGHGLETVTERGDRVFPASHKAADVVDTLRKAACNAGAEIMTGCEVRDIVKNGNGFTVLTAGGTEIRAGKVIVATGGLSYPATGSTGDGYLWAEKSGHRIKACFPSLTALVPEDYKITDGKNRNAGHIPRENRLTELGKSLMGNQLKNISLAVEIDGNEVQTEFGDIDFTDGGIEGPAGFRVSRRCVSAVRNGSKVKFRIDLKPAVETAALNKRIAALWDEITSDRRSRGKSRSDMFRILLGKLMPVSLIDGFMKSCGTADVRNLADRLKNWEFRIQGYVGYERCVVTAGGISADEISPRTMESKLVRGLFFAGEVIDIDGDTGGYNLQAAFSTGMLAGQSAAAGT